MRQFAHFCFLFALAQFTPSCGGTPQSAAADSGIPNPDAGTDLQPAPSASASTSVTLVVPPLAPDVAPCSVPFAPVLEALPSGARLPVFANPADGMRLGLAGAGSTEPTTWIAGTLLDLPASDTEVQVFAQLDAGTCPGSLPFSQAYSVRTTFAPAAEQPGSTAVAKDASVIHAWATQVLAVQYGAEVADTWRKPERALGPAGDDTTAVVSLGEGGSITVGFDAAIADGTGYDLVVFENSFSDYYLELAFVEVSSDNVHFARFDTASLTNTSVGPYGTVDPQLLQGFAGKYRVGWGTPFDLAWLKSQPEVRAGQVDLSHITAVRIVDIVGDGRTRDSLGHVVYDPYPTTASAGFDLDAIGVINVAP